MSDGAIDCMSACEGIEGRMQDVVSRVVIELSSVWWRWHEGMEEGQSSHEA